jgi:hypothetical protein
MVRDISWFWVESLIRNVAQVVGQYGRMFDNGEFNLSERHRRIAKLESNKVEIGILACDHPPGER